MADLVVDIIDDGREVVGRSAVRPKDHEVIDDPRLETHFVAHQVQELDRCVLWNREANNT